MTIGEVTIRLVIAALVSGCIGYEREYKNRPAGIRTHIFLCLGATIIALIQQQIMADSIEISINTPELRGVISSDPARLIAQVISGVGFLGAGTIVINKRNIVGLTTAASLWTVACLGLSIGMGYYKVALLGSLFILFVLFILNKIIRVPSLKKIEIQYIHRIETKEFLNNYFENEKVFIKDVDFSVDVKEDYRVYKNIYTVELPKGLNYTDIIEDISIFKNVEKVVMIGI